MTTPNTPVSTKPAADMAVEATIDELMRAVDEVSELETYATLKANQDNKHDPDYMAADAKHVEARNKLKNALRAAIARPQEVAGVTNAIRKLAEIERGLMVDPPHVMQFAEISAQLRNVREGLAASRAPVAVGATRVCGNAECGWAGATERLCGSIGPLCPSCGETTELATPAPSVPLGGREAWADSLRLMLFYAVQWAGASANWNDRDQAHIDTARQLLDSAHPLQAQDAAPVEPTDEDLWELRRQAKADPRCADQHWFILFARAAIAASKPVPWMTGGDGAEGKFRDLIEQYVQYRKERVNGPEPELEQVKRDLDAAICALFSAAPVPAGVQGDAARVVIDAGRYRWLRGWGVAVERGGQIYTEDALDILVDGNIPLDAAISTPSGVKGAV